MNASRLREITELLLQREQKFGIQQLLNELNSYIANLAANPQDPGTQTNFANGFDKLTAAMSGMMDSFQPAQVKLLEEIGADKFFTTNLPAQISAWIKENPMTPAVTQQKIAKLAGDRSAFIEDITQVRDRLKKLKIEAVNLPAGTAEIGFLIPRDLFHNQFDELIKELGALNYIMRAISEVATGKTQPIEVRQISTTDPQFFFGLDAPTIVTLGAIVTWALAQWKQVEEIRKLRSETSKNDAFTEKEIKEFFDAKIEKNIREAIDAKATELLDTSQGTHSPQKHTEIAWAIESVLARVERGVTVEIRFVPPATNADADGPPDPNVPQFSEIEKTAKALVFPEPDRTPILQLPPPQPEKTSHKSKETK